MQMSLMKCPFLLEQAGGLLPGAPESPDDPAQVGEGDGDAHQQREGRHQVNLVHRGRVVVVEVEPEADYIGWYSTLSMVCMG